MADTLSRRDAESMLAFALSAPVFDIFSTIRQEVEKDANLQQLKVDICANRKGPSWGLHDGLIMVERRIFVQAFPRSVTAHCPGTQYRTRGRSTNFAVTSGRFLDP